MKTITILGENRFASHSKVREACRGIVVRDGKLLLTYEVNSDQWFLPGGGLEKGGKSIPVLYPGTGRGDRLGS